MTPSRLALRQYAIARSLRRADSIEAAVARLGFVQADPIRSPARAQDLTLRHRVPGYRAGDLERRTRRSAEEDFFVNYGFVPRAVYRLMHPRSACGRWVKPGQAQGRSRAGVRPRARGSIRAKWTPTSRTVR